MTMNTKYSSLFLSGLVLGSMNTIEWQNDCLPYPSVARSRIGDKGHHGQAAFSGYSSCKILALWILSLVCKINDSQHIGLRLVLFLVVLFRSYLQYG